MTIQATICDGLGACTVSTAGQITTTTTGIADVPALVRNSTASVATLLSRSPAAVNASIANQALAIIYSTASLLNSAADTSPQAALSRQTLLQVTRNLTARVNITADRARDISTVLVVLTAKPEVGS
jgi:hypothetical protein